MERTTSPAAANVNKPGYYNGVKITYSYFCRHYGYVSKGNLKLKPTKKEKFIIFNVISGNVPVESIVETAEKIAGKMDGFDYKKSIERARDLSAGDSGMFKGCPHATAQCYRLCYDRKAQNGYRKSSIFPSRVRNFLFSLSDDFVPVMRALIYNMCHTPAYKAADTVYIRIHEGGEMYAPEYLRKWIRICISTVTASKAGRIPAAVKPYTYSKCFPFLAPYAKTGGGFTFDSYLIVNGSIWPDTRPEYVDFVNDHNMPLYTVLPKEEVAAMRETDGLPVHICECRDCGDCGACAELKRKVVAVHGGAI